MDAEDDWLESGPSSAGAQGSAADPIVEQEYQRIATRYSDAGYREGITDGKLSTLQEGFDASFALSVRPSRQLGSLRGRATALLSYLTSSASASSSSGPGVASARAVRTGVPPSNPASRPPSRSSSPARPIPSSQALQAQRAQVTEDLRDLLRDLGAVRRGDVLPPDEEMEAHEREAHAGGEGAGDEAGKTKGGREDAGFSLDWTEKREMESLELGLAGLSGGAGGVSGQQSRKHGAGLREAELLRSLELRLADLIQRAMRHRA